jgi:hypothetical protein
MRRIAGLTVVLTACLVGTASADPPVYPPPSKPKVQPKPHGPFHTLRVGRHARFKTISAAVKKARAGDTIRVANGTYHEGVIVQGAKKRYLRIIGNVKHPGKVRLEGKRLKGARAQNGVQVNGADNVTVRGLTAQHYKANGFFFVNVNRYVASNLQAFQVGTYGIYAFNSVGGKMSHDVAAWNNDSGFYVGQTPPQVRPVRTLVDHVTSYGNVLGFSGTNMRYVTITHSKWFNNGTGIVPNALHSEKYAPPEDNVITDNDVFWNNFNYYAGAPFKQKAGGTSVGNVPFPIGVGILLFGGRGNQVTGNRVFGNWLVGIGALQALTLKQADARDLKGNQVRDNILGKDGTDLNGRDLFYDGNGSDNCFGPNVGVQVVFPESGATMKPCPYTGANAFDQQALATAVDWTVSDPTHEAHYIRHDHAPIAGLTPLERYTGGVQ